MSEGPILVTGAAGGPQGSTGNWVSRFLLERGVRVRTFVHRIDERSDELSALGPEVVQGDLLEIASVRRATAGAPGVLCLSCPGRLTGGDDHLRCCRKRGGP